MITIKNSSLRIFSGSYTSSSSTSLSCFCSFPPSSVVQCDHWTTGPDHQSVSPLVINHQIIITHGSYFHGLASISHRLPLLTKWSKRFVNQAFCNEEAFNMLNRIKANDIRLMPNEGAKCPCNVCLIYRRYTIDRQPDKHTEGPVGQ